MIRPQMTAHQAESLAAFVVSLRPGQRAWTKAAVLDKLRAAAEQRTNDTEILARAAMRAALDPSVRTPDVLPMKGRHWDGVGDYDTTADGTTAEPCGVCREVHNRTYPCPGEPRPAPTRGERVQTFAQQARAAIAEAKSGMCRHGVKLAQCKQPHDRPSADAGLPEEASA